MYKCFFFFLLFFFFILLLLVSFVRFWWLLYTLLLPVITFAVGLWCLSQSTNFNSTSRYNFVSFLWWCCWLLLLFLCCCFVILCSFHTTSLTDWVITVKYLSAHMWLCMCVCVWCMFNMYIYLLHIWDIKKNGILCTSSRRATSTISNFVHCT